MDAVGERRGDTSDSNKVRKLSRPVSDGRLVQSVYRLRSGMPASHDLQPEPELPPGNGTSEMHWTYVVIGLLSGVVLPLQAAVNAQLRQVLASAVLAALVSFLVGTVALLGYAAMTRTVLTDWRAAALAPWWAWLGGLLGAIYVVTAILVTPRLGAAALVAVTVTGQLVAALVMDHFGWLGLPLQPLSSARIVGAVLLMAGVFLMTRP